MTPAIMEEERWKKKPTLMDVGLKLFYLNKEVQFLVALLIFDLLELPSYALETLIMYVYALPSRRNGELWLV